MAVSATTVESEVAYFLGYGYASNAGGSTGAFLDNIARRAMKNFDSDCDAKQKGSHGIVGSQVVVA